MKKLFKKLPKLIFKLIFSHKLISFISLLIIIFGGYFGFKAISGKGEQVRYVTAAIEKGMLSVSVSGSGQVSVSDQIDVKPKASGDVVYVGAKNGQEVKTGAFLVQIDTSSAQRAVQDAEISLEAARVQIEELLEPPDELAILQAERSLAKARESKQKAEDNIVEGYEDAFNAITNAFFDLPTIITGLNTILYSYEIADSELTVSDYWNISALVNSVDADNKDELEKFIKRAENDYNTARTKYNKNFENYRDASRYSEQEVIEALLEETLETVRAMAETVKSEINMIDFWVDHRSRRDLRVFSVVTGYQSNLKSYTSKTNSLLSSLLSIQRSFQSYRDAVVDAEYSIREKELSLEKLMAGPDDLDVRSKKSTIQQREEALITARENLAGCYIYAPFDGVVAEVYVKTGDSASSGTKLLTLASKQKIAEITLNEIDIAKVKTGQKATITLDAIEDLTITGEIVEIDTLGTTSQGVVTYDVKIVFDTQDERVKSGMSLSVAIITDVKQNVLLVSNSAIKYQGDMQYVEIMTNETLRSQVVEVGISNDTMSEIISGLKEGDKVVTQTISSSTTTQASATQNQKLQIPGTSVPGGMQMQRMMR